MKFKQKIIISFLVVGLMVGMTIQVSATGELFQAVKNGDANQIENLTSNNLNIDVNSTNKYGGTALMMAALEGNIEAVEILLDNGAKINAKSNKGATALILAAGKGHTKLVKLLVEAGANINAESKQGWSALDLAKYFSKQDVVKVLRELGVEE